MTVGNIQQEYDKDFYSWLLHNLALMRAGKLAEIDRDNLAKELESMGKSERRTLISRLAILMAHLLKWKYQPVKHSKS